MKKLSEFATLAEAKAYVYTPLVKPARDIRTYLIRKNKWSVLRGIEADLQDSLCDAATGLIKAADEGTPLSFNPDSEDGQFHLGMLEAFVTGGFIGGSQKQDITDLGGYKPYEGVTSHEFQVATDTCPRKEVAYSDGWAAVTVNAQCEKHDARVFGTHPVMGVVQVSNIKGIEETGVYHFRVPLDFQQGPLYVDDAYGVI